MFTSHPTSVKKLIQKFWDGSNACEDLSRIGAELTFIIPVLENIPEDDFVVDCSTVAMTSSLILSRNDGFVKREAFTPPV
jgi:hypothetical protein